MFIHQLLLYSASFGALTHLSYTAMSCFFISFPFETSFLILHLAFCYCSFQPHLTAIQVISGSVFDVERGEDGSQEQWRGHI